MFYLELPKILLPKDGKFKSFRHSLLLYSQRKYSKIPQYKTEKEHYGFIGMVIINGETIRSKVIAPHEKEADARAAFQALTQFGYLEGMSFEMQHNRKQYMNIYFFILLIFLRILKFGSWDCHDIALMQFSGISVGAWCFFRRGEEARAFIGT